MSRMVHRTTYPKSTKIHLGEKILSKMAAKMAAKTYN